ncbi:hypothetical protein ACQKL5_14030 [Peribacillus sp. NPDC097675]|uniref:hypothetical protein n=1 Tax=Peribacillus sp. NPDC097675 TaxID=3390618 RepID=UPI003CFEADD1
MSIFSKGSNKFGIGKILAQFQSGDSITIEIFPGYIFTVDNKFNAALKKKEEDKCKHDNKCKKHDNMKEE